MEGAHIVAVTKLFLAESDWLHGIDNSQLSKAFWRVWLARFLITDKNVKLYDDRSLVWRRTGTVPSSGHLESVGTRRYSFEMSGG